VLYADVYASVYAFVMFFAALLCPIYLGPNDCIVRQGVHFVTWRL